MNLNFSPNGEALTKSEEGFSLTPYKDQAGILTIYYGHRILPNETFNNTQAEAEKIFLRDTAGAVSTVNSAVTFTIGQNAFNALVDFCYNIGSAHFRSSTLLKLLNAGNIQGASEQFICWNKVAAIDAHGHPIYNPDGTPAHVVSAGLSSRRLKEKELFLTPDVPLPLS